MFKELKDPPELRKIVLHYGIVWNTSRACDGPKLYILSLNSAMNEFMIAKEYIFVFHLGVKTELGKVMGTSSME